MSSGTDFKVVRRSSPSQLAKVLLWIKFYGFYKLKNFLKLCGTIAKMLITREKRLYYMYSTCEVITVTAFNYVQLVKVDGAEFALIKFKNKDGFVYHKAERF